MNNISMLIGIGIIILLPLVLSFPREFFYLYAFYPVIILWITSGFYRSEELGISVIGIFDTLFILVALVYTIAKRKKINTVIRGIPGYIYLIILVLFILLLILIYGNLFSYLKNWMKFIFLDAVILAYLYYIIKEEKNRGFIFIKRILTLLLFLIVSFNLYNYLSGEYNQYIERGGFIFSRYDYEGENVTMGANTLGALVALYIPFLFCCILISKKFFIKTFYTFLFFASIFLIMVTVSRAPILAMFISLFTFSYYLSKNKKVFLYLIFIVGLILFLPYIQIFVEDAVQRDSNLMGRIYLIWLPTLELGLKDNPLIGHGIASFQEFSKSIWGVVRSPHNIIVRFLYEIGIVGTGLYILFYYKVFKYILNNIKNLNRREKLIVASFLSGLVAWWVCAMSAEVYNLLFRITNYLFIIGSIYLIQRDQQYYTVKH
jgi:teichuronic acid biosynthesis protein TuaE